MKKTFLLAVSALLLASSAAVAQKMSPDTEILLHKHQVLKKSPDARKRALARDVKTNEEITDGTVGAFVTVSGPWVADKLREAGCSVGTVLDDIITIDAPIDLLPVIAQMDGVEFVEISHKAEIKNYHSRIRMHVNEVQNGLDNLPQSYRGRDVVVGVIDIGFEYAHVAYRKYDGSFTPRLTRIWNQNKAYGGTPPEKYDYGVEYRPAEDGLPSDKFDTTAEFHGTHTSIIAAGSPAGGNQYYYGMAPDADIVLVAADLNNDNHLIDAVKYIFDYAESVGKPCVINMSLGSHYGPHDGKSAIDRAVSSMVGPGKLVVGSVGNEAGVKLHCSKTFTDNDTTLQTMMAYTDGYSKATLTYLWGSPGTDFTVEVALVDPTRNGKIIQTTGPISTSTSTKTAILMDGTTSEIELIISPVVIQNGGSPQMTVQSTVYDLAPNRKQAFIIRGEKGQTVHLWNAVNDHFFVSGNIRGFTAGDNWCTAGEIGGTGEGVISVGSYDSDSILLINSDPEPLGLHLKPMMEAANIDFYTGQRSTFSSQGPTADGRMKPEVLAPGFMIISGYNKYTEVGSLGGYEVIMPSADNEGNAYLYEMSQGTSQASPAVAGTIALWLEADPNLTPDDIRGILSRTCDRDEYTGSEPNNSAGYGKINALAGIRDILGLTAAIDDVVVSDKSTHVWVEDGHTIYCACEGRADVTLHTVSGMTVGTYSVTPDNRTIDASSLQPGVYVVRVATQGSTQSFKVLIR